jgi:hypothetical protein
LLGSEVGYLIVFFYMGDDFLGFGLSTGGGVVGGWMRGRVESGAETLVTTVLAETSVFCLFERGERREGER